MTMPERRQTPRTTVNRLAYINLEANSGGIVLNVSNGGLCFHSVTPVRRAETIRFWFSEANHRIEGCGELAWMDEAQKTAGLRFTNLSPEARVKIHDWISQPATPPTASGRSAPSLSSPSEIRSFNASRPDRNAARVSPAPLEVPSPNMKAPTLLRGFAGGLVFGLLISVLVATAFLVHTYRREFGDSLIRLGERLGARYQPRTVSPSPESVSAAPPSPPFTENAPTQFSTKAVKPQQMKIEAAAPVATTRVPTVIASPPTTAPAISSGSPRTSLPTTAVEPDASEISGNVDTVPELGPANHPSGHAEDSRAGEAGSSSTTYLEVDKFRGKMGADTAMDKLTQLGFHAIVVQKAHLWMNSYQVLVGPYGSEDEAEAAHKNLVSHGFRPRSYEKGSRSLTLPSELTLNGAHMPVGAYLISWDSYIPDAFVKFERDGIVLVRAEGKWVRRGVKYEDDAIVYRKNGDGSRTLLEMRFGGMSQALVFAKSS